MKDHSHKYTPFKVIEREGKDKIFLIILSFCTCGDIIETSLLIDNKLKE